MYWVLVFSTSTVQKKRNTLKVDAYNIKQNRIIKKKNIKFLPLQRKTFEVSCSNLNLLNKNLFSSKRIFLFKMLRKSSRKTTPSH